MEHIVDIKMRSINIEKLRNKKKSKAGEYLVRKIRKISSDNGSLNIIDKAFNNRTFDPKISPANTLEHELAKCKIIYLLRKRKIKCYGETRFNNGTRADIYVPGKSTIIEVMQTETRKKLETKTKKYPSEIAFIYGFTTEDVMSENFGKKLYEYID